jgi:single-stranded-DNA-specific exonuclease
MDKQIIRRDASSHDALNELHPLLQRIYTARKIQSKNELDRELDNLHSYHQLLGIDKAVSILADGIQHNKSILIVGDFDADGATSTALAIRALKSFGAEKIQFLVPNRFAFGYGLTPELIASSKDFAADIIVTVDNGIANHAGVEAAKALGMSVIITDHHLAGDTLPIADAIVNPNQPHDVFPSKNLAGVGVIFYVMVALRRYLHDIEWFKNKKIPEPNMSRFLDLVALGTVADLVPLDHNNRILVHQGLRRIRAGQCIPGIIALLELANRDFSHATTADLGFAVAARLNAAGRIDDMSLGIDCLLCDDSFKTREIARHLNDLNDERKQIEQDMQAQALHFLKDLNLKSDLPKSFCLFNESWHQGVIGILAARIKEKFNRPVVVFAKGTEGEIKGSARSISSIHVRDVLALIDVKYPHLIKKFGGHAMAAGLTIAESNFAEFAKVFTDTVAEQIKDEDLQHVLLSDGELIAEDFTLDTAAMLREAGPWGQAFPEPLFDNVFQIVDQRLVGNKHLKLVLAQSEKILDAIAFFVDLNIWPNHRCRSVHAAYRLDINEFKGNRNVQLIIEHLVPC